MTALLVVVTLVSLALAGALLVHVLKLSREERDRSEARAAALADLLEARTSPEPGVATEPRSGPAARPEPPLRVEPHPGIALVEPDGPEETRAADLFTGAMTTNAREGTMRRLLAPAIGVAIVSLALSTVYLWNRPTPAAQSAEAAARPLELVTLRHQRLGDTLVITGLVRNPPDGSAVKGLVAVAFAFDRQGTFLTSGRSVPDFPQLQAGEESPFSITIPQAEGVGRYRVSFRTGAGLVPHIDRRNAPPSAQQASAQ